MTFTSSSKLALWFAPNWMVTTVNKANGSFAANAVLNEEPEKAPEVNGPTTPDEMFVPEGSVEPVNCADAPPVNGDAFD